MLYSFPVPRWFPPAWSVAAGRSRILILVLVTACLLCGRDAAAQPDGKTYERPVLIRVVNSENGEIAFMSEQELQATNKPGLWDKKNLVYDSREKHFLTVNGDEAVTLQLAVGTVADRDGLRERYPFEGNLRVFDRTMVDMVIGILNWPIVTGLLFIIGLIALYVELSAPGLGIGGGIAGLCFGLFFWSRFLGGTADWLEVMLFLMGVCFILIELFVIPGFGVFGISGLLLLVTSVVMASQHFLIPSSDLEMNATVGTLVVVAGSGLVSLVAAAILSRYFGKVPVISWLALEPGGSSEAVGGKRDRIVAPARFDGIRVGDRGLTESALRPAGQAQFDGGSVDVVSDGSFVEAGKTVRVIEISGNRVVVREE